MALHINNPEVERMARELAERRGVSLTQTLHDALIDQREKLRPERRPTREEDEAWMEDWRKRAGIDLSKITPMTKEDWDDLWEEGIRDPEPR